MRLVVKKVHTISLGCPSLESLHTSKSNKLDSHLQVNLIFYSRATYRVPKSELALSGVGKTGRHQQTVLTNECQLGRFALPSVTLTHLPDTHRHTRKLLQLGLYQTELCTVQAGACVSRYSVQSQNLYFFAVLERRLYTAVNKCSLILCN